MPMHNAPTHKVGPETPSNSNNQKAMIESNIGPPTNNASTPLESSLARPNCQVEIPDGIPTSNTRMTASISSFTPPLTLARH